MYNAWMQVNETGPALCYPTCRTPFLMAIVFSQLKSTLSRSFLLVVCMGLGVTRPTLPGIVWCAIVFVHVIFFSFSLNVDIQDVANVVSNGTTEQIWTMPAVLSDLFIVMWIFLALNHTRSELKVGRCVCCVVVVCSPFSSLFLFSLSFSSMCVCVYPALFSAHLFSAAGTKMNPSLQCLTS